MATSLLPTLQPIKEKVSQEDKKHSFTPAASVGNTGWMRTRDGRIWKNQVQAHTLEPAPCHLGYPVLVTQAVSPHRVGG